MYSPLRPYVWSIKPNVWSISGAKTLPISSLPALSAGVDYYMTCCFAYLLSSLYNMLERRRRPSFVSFSSTDTFERLA